MKTKPVAAVYNRRTTASPELIERRHRKTRRWIVCLLLFFPLFLSAAPKKDAAPPVEPTVVYDTSVNVLRGGTCEVQLRAISPQGYDVIFEVLAEPRFGSLSGPQRNSKSSVSYFYTHDGKKSSPDSFRFKCKSGPQKAWGYAKATILVQEPPARFSADLAALDFGSVFLGESRTLPLRIKNIGGGRLQGRLKVSPPWLLRESSEISLAEGETKKILVTFTPLSTDTQRGSLVFESGNKSSAEVALEGVGERRFDAPASADFEQRIGSSELRIPVKNRTAAPLTVSIHCPAPLETVKSLQLPPQSDRELLLKLPARPFAEKSVLLTLGDDAATFDIRIQLPPPPSRIEWEIDGTNELGRVTPERILPISATLRNTGGSTAKVVIRPMGDGLTLAPNQQEKIEIPSGEQTLVQGQWKFSNTIGSTQAALVAETQGLAPVEAVWNAEVHKPALPEPTPQKSQRASAPVSTPEQLKLLSPEESENLSKILPQNPTYQLIPDLRVSAFLPSQRTVTAIVSWSHEGPAQTEFIIQLERQQRKGFFDKNPFERSLSTTYQLPPQSLEAVWTPLESSVAGIHKLPDGRWQARIPSLSPGYHKIRILAKQPNNPRLDGVDFSLFVGSIPLPQPLSWLFPALFAFCATYLLRNKIRSLF